MDTGTTERPAEGPAAAPRRSRLRLGLELVGWATFVAVIGLLWAFPDAVSRVRASFGPYLLAPEGCDPAAAPCEAAFADGARVRLRVHPEAPRGGEPLIVQVELDGDPATPVVELQGLDMPMGLIQVPLTAQGPSWVGQVVLPVCATERMTWRADVRFGERAVGFTLTTRS